MFTFLLYKKRRMKIEESSSIPFSVVGEIWVPSAKQRSPMQFASPSQLKATSTPC
jgi:hypothetical protein